MSKNILLTIFLSVFTFLVSSEIVGKQPSPVSFDKLSDELLDVLGNPLKEIQSGGVRFSQYGYVFPVIVFFDSKANLDKYHSEILRVDPNAKKTDGKLYRFVSASMTVPQIIDWNIETNVEEVWYNHSSTVELDKTIDHLSAKEVHRSGFLAEGVKVGVIDTGVDLNHPALRGRNHVQADFSSAVIDTLDDLDGHGTHVAGIIANSLESTHIGVAPGSIILSARSMDDSDLVEYLQEEWGRTDAILLGIDWAFEQGARIFNMSGRFLTDQIDGESQGARLIDYLVSKHQCIFIKSAGNGDGESITSPADAYNVVSVAASDIKDDDREPYIAAFSSVGLTEDGRNGIRMTAPGDSIFSSNHNWETERERFVSKRGTSMASPHVTGLAAILKGISETERRSFDSKIFRAVSFISSVKIEGPNDSDEWTNTPTMPLDFNQGAGEIEIDDTVNYYKSENPHWLTDRIGSTQLKQYRINVTDSLLNLRIALCWDKHLETRNYSTLIISDLNLALSNIDGTIIKESKSTVDNVEFIDHDQIPGEELPEGEYILTVQPATIQPGFLHETFALASTAPFLQESLGDAGTGVWHEAEVNWEVDYGSNWAREGIVEVPGASRIKLFFSEIDTEACCDRLTTTLGDEWKGSFNGIWSQEQVGSSIRLFMQSDRLTNGTFTIKKVAWQGTAADAIPQQLGELFAEVSEDEDIVWHERTVSWRVKYGRSWNRTGWVDVPGASRIRLQFRRINTEQNVDVLSTSSGNSWSGGFRNQWSLPKNGQTMQLKMKSNYQNHGDFVISRVAWQGGSASSQPQMQGRLFETEDNSVWFQAEVDQTVEYGNKWNRTGSISVPGATKLRIFFSNIDVEPNSDFLRSTTKDEWSTIEENIWSREQIGSEIELSLASDQSREGQFTISRVEWQGGDEHAVPAFTGELFQTETVSPSSADLRVDVIETDVFFATEGSTVTIKCFVENVGSQTAEAAVCELYISSQSSILTLGDRLEETKTVTVSPFSTEILEWTFQIPSDISEEDFYKIWVRCQVDVTENVVELDENNTFRLQTPIYVISDG